jgi:tetratricopeptide (TPR) repeat protein
MALPACGDRIGDTDVVLLAMNLARAISALQQRRFVEAEALLRDHLRTHPADAEALRLLASVAAATGAAIEAERLLQQAIRIAPKSVLPHADLASLLCREDRVEEALVILDEATAADPNAVWPLSLRAAVLMAEGRTEEVLILQRRIVDLAPDAAVPWLNFAHSLRAVGKRDEAEAAYRRAVAIEPANGFGWWGIVNLVAERLTSSDIRLIDHGVQFQRDDLQRALLHFAFARALDRHRDYANAFHHYTEANRIRGNLVPYDPEAIIRLVDSIKTTFDRQFFADRAAWGSNAFDPIFIIGMPRSGSTLVEQILASHPMVEGCGELFALRNIVAGVGGPAGPDENWPSRLGALSAPELAALGQTYLTKAARFRRTGRPRFTDKMPANWQLVGLIQLILPHARIIDVRRDPVACCFSNFTTYFNAQTSVPSSLEQLGAFYSNYVCAMDHYEWALPGKIYRLSYEALVTNPEDEIRSLLAYLGLPYDAACLRFHEHARTIHTPSAEQVRRPLNREGLDRWRHYQSWLAHLNESLGRIGTSPL